MTTRTHIDWTGQAPQLAAAAHEDHAWYRAVARELVGGADRLAVDVGCGAAGMALAMASHMVCGRIIAVDGEPAIVRVARDHVRGEWVDPRVRIDVLHTDLAEGVQAIRAAAGGPVDLVWASAAIHHLGDQQQAINALVSLLGPGGRLALAEGGLPARHLPWDLGLGTPGLELRLQVAEDRWFADMRAALPGSRRMPYGWSEALRRAGLTPVTTGSTLTESPSPLPEPERLRVGRNLTDRVERLRDTGFLDEADLAVWDRLCDPADACWLGRRNDLNVLEVRSIHVGVDPDRR
jgi:SAM-dependent methyltransferase